MPDLSTLPMLFYLQKDILIFFEFDKSHKGELRELTEHQNLNASKTQYLYKKLNKPSKLF